MALLSLSGTARAADDGTRTVSSARHGVLERAFPSLTGYGLFEAEHPGTLDHLQPGFGFALSYGRDVDSVVDGPMDTLFAGHLRAGFGLLDQFQVSVGFPFLLVRDDEASVTSEGLGDGFFALKGRILGDPRRGLSLGALVAATLAIERKVDSRMMPLTFRPWVIFEATPPPRDLPKTITWSRGTSFSSHPSAACPDAYNPSSEGAPLLLPYPG